VDGRRHLLRVKLSSHHEFVPTETSNDVGFTKGCGQQLCGFDQRYGAYAVPKFIVDDLQIVHIDKENPKRQARAAGKPKRLFRKKVKSSEVIQPGQFIPEGEVVYLVLHAIHEPYKQKEQYERGGGCDRRENCGGILRGSKLRSHHPRPPNFTQKRQYEQN